MNNQTTLAGQAKDYITYQVNKAYFSTARIDKVSDVMRFQISIAKHLDFINVSKYLIFSRRGNSRLASDA